MLTVLHCQELALQLLRYEIWQSLFFPFPLSSMHVAYHHCPHWLLVTLHPLKSWVPTSALCLALTPTLCYCFCRPRLDSVVPVFTNENVLEKTFEEIFGFSTSGYRWFEWFLQHVQSAWMWLDVGVICILSHVTAFPHSMTFCAPSYFLVPLLQSTWTFYFCLICVADVPFSFSWASIVIIFVCS